jgi:hypothetical protein
MFSGFPACHWDSAAVTSGMSKWVVPAALQMLAWIVESASGEWPECDFEQARLDVVEVYVGEVIEKAAEGHRADASIASREPVLGDAVWLCADVLGVIGDQPGRVGEQRGVGY